MVTWLSLAKVGTGDDQHFRLIIYDGVFIKLCDICQSRIDRQMYRMAFETHKKVSKTGLNVPEGEYFDD